MLAWATPRSLSLPTLKVAHPGAIISPVLPGAGLSSFLAAQGGDGAKACFENRSGQFEKCSVLTRTAERVAEGYCLSPVQQPRSMHPPYPRHGAGYCFGAVLLEGDSTVSLGLILVIILIIFLLGGFSGRFGGYGYGFGHGGVGIIGIILIVVVVLLLMGRL